MTQRPWMRMPAPGPPTSMRYTQLLAAQVWPEKQVKHPFLQE